MGYVLLSSKHLLMEGYSTSNLNSGTNIIRYDDWSYELGINEFENEEKCFIPVKDDNNNGGQGCAIFVLFLIITVFVYYLIAV